MAAQAALRKFMRRIDRYSEERNNLDVQIASGLSPYLHFGHLSSHEVCRKVLERENWTFDRLGSQASGSRESWWGLSRPSEAFLDPAAKPANSRVFLDTVPTLRGVPVMATWVDVEELAMVADPRWTDGLAVERVVEVVPVPVDEPEPVSGGIDRGHVGPTGPGVDRGRFFLSYILQPVAGSS